ncbi:MAG: hypothetical protein ACK4QP_08165 [Pseudorhizobium sp.]
MSTILNKIRKGMTVCDPNGTRIGTVEFVRLSDEDPSDPGAQSVTPSTLEPGHSLLDFVADSLRTDEVPEPLRARLQRHGFIRVDAAGLFAADRYVMPDQIASVAEDQVMLNVDKDMLVKRQ